MRTTVEIPDPLYRRVRATAAERGMRGFSRLVEEALTEYLAHENERRELRRAFEAARGAWSSEAADEWQRDVREAWSSWQTAPS